jgi:C4-type Zn-finger protein
MSWVCEDCGFNEEEVKTVYEPSDKVRIINQLLVLGDDYDFIRYSQLHFVR